MKKHYIILTICTIFCILQTWAHPYKVSEIPMVHLQDRTRYVSNPDGILSVQTVNSIDSILYALEQKTGIETLVVAVNEIEGGDCFEFALQLGKQNGVGKKETNNGLVILLVTQERCIQFVTGYGLEGILPDAICRRIQTQHMNSYFGKADWDTGMLAGIRAVNSYLRNYHDGTENGKRPTGFSASDYYPFIFAGIIFIVFFIFAYKNQRRKNRCPHCKKHTLRRTDSRFISNINGIRKEEVVYTCAHCGYTVVHEEESHDDHDGFGGRGGGPIIFGGGLFGRGNGGGFNGGSFGGGDFGGGGSGSKF